MTPRLRNEFLIDQADKIVCGYVSSFGSIRPLVDKRPRTEYLCTKLSSVVAETETHPFRWSVGEDKALLRMYYNDHSIHYIHCQLRRSYQAIRNRIHSITMSEEVLKGREFEDFVLGLFDMSAEGGFSLKEWRGDKNLGDIRPTNNSCPDFFVEHEKGCFAIECKWRQAMSLKILTKTFPSSQLETYKAYGKEKRAPVIIALGVGGEACAPEKLYLIPLEELERCVAAETSFQKYLRSAPDVPLTVSSPELQGVFKPAPNYTIEEKREKNPHAYMSWSVEDDSLLSQLYQSGTGITQLTLQFGRSRKAITSRLRKLGLNLTHNDD